MLKEKLYVNEQNAFLSFVELVCIWFCLTLATFMFDFFLFFYPKSDYFPITIKGEPQFLFFLRTIVSEILVLVSEPQINVEISESEKHLNVLKCFIG